MPAISLVGIGKRFGATTALADVSLDVAQGSSHALIGENGAGKSTLVKVLSGVIRADHGVMTIFGTEVRPRSPSHAETLGVVTAFQELSLVPDLTVAENLFLGSDWPGAGPVVLKRKLRARADEVLTELSIDGIDPDWLVADLTLPEKQLIEIAKAVRKRPRILLLDEPTSALGDDAMEWFYALVRNLRAHGTTILFITHRLAETRKVCERVTILRNGRLVATRAMGEISSSEVIHLMIGRSLEAAFPPKRAGVERPPALEVRQLTKRPILQDVSFTLGRGEILGVAGLEGQGQRELFLTLFGAMHPEAGEILIEGRPVKIRSPRDAVHADIGISLVPEERKTEGLFLRLPVQTNMALPAIGRLSTLGWTNGGLVRRKVRHAAERVNVNRALLGKEAGFLSGGNQQKVVIGKWVLTGSKYFLLYDPTRGVDVGTKFEIYSLLHELAESGISILFYSSELPELINMADRILVFYRSRIVAEFSGADQTEDRVMAAAIGDTEAAVA